MAFLFPARLGAAWLLTASLAGAQAPSVDIGTTLSDSSRSASAPPSGMTAPAPADASRAVAPSSATTSPAPADALGATSPSSAAGTPATAPAELKAELEKLNAQLELQTQTQQEMLTALQALSAQAVEQQRRQDAARASSSERQQALESSLTSLRAAQVALLHGQNDADPYLREAQDALDDQRESALVQADSAEAGRAGEALKWIEFARGALTRRGVEEAQRAISIALARLSGPSSD
jgi:hypothetical protein